MTLGCAENRNRSENLCPRIRLFQAYISVMRIRWIQTALLGLGPPIVSPVLHCVSMYLTHCGYFKFMAVFVLIMYRSVFESLRSFPPTLLPS